MGGAEDRHERLRRLVTENRRRRRRPELVERLAAVLGYEPPLDAFLALDAAEQLWAAITDHAKYHLVWHRIWGDRLASEVTRTLRELAARLDGTDAYLLLRNPLEAVCVPMAPILRHEADDLSRRTDLMLITRDRKSGLVLTWDHLSYADEYSLLTWGDFALDLSAEQRPLSR